MVFPRRVGQAWFTIVKALVLVGQQLWYSYIALFKSASIIRNYDAARDKIRKTNQKEYQQLQDEYNILVLVQEGMVMFLFRHRSNQKRFFPGFLSATLMSYVVSKTHTPKNMRNEMLRIVGDDHYYFGDGWRSAIQDSKFSLCPRGFGRTSYHVMETLQMGLIPIHVYLDDDIPWIPYDTTFLQNVNFLHQLGEPPYSDH
jgi:hypothetical protein